MSPGSCASHAPEGWMYGRTEREGPMAAWRARLVLSVVVLALLAAGCSGDSDGRARISDVLDGLVFTVDELLIGDLGGLPQLTVAFLALRVNEDGSPHSRVVGAPFGVIRPGI